MKELEIRDWSRERGYRIAIGGAEFLETAHQELNLRKQRGEIDSGFFREYLSFMAEPDKIGMTHPLSIIIVAVPRPAHIIRFEYGERIIKMVLPPTYVGYRALFETIRSDLETHVFPGRNPLTILSSPLKSLSGLLGLVNYGRNNLTYIPEFGSYFQLAGYLIDAQLDKTEFRISGESLDGRVKPLLSQCAKCRACVNACPMGAIAADRFLLHAEKCYTRFSESASPIPAGIYPPSPDCIIGCMECQRICPANKNRLAYEDTGVLFSSKETRAILEPHRMNQRLSQEIDAQLDPLGLSENNDIFFRNFRNYICYQSEKKS